MSIRDIIGHLMMRYEITWIEAAQVFEILGLDGMPNAQALDMILAAYEEAGRES
jgi:hypothetical protein